MSEQLPSVNPNIREQLARRASGKLPEGLAGEVFTALDSATPRRTIWRVPRLAVAAMGMTLIAVLAVSIGFSAVHTGPAATATSFAGYPAERALTTAELASLMAGPPLPQNTALVASVTIDVRLDVCPMNSRPTVGVVEGMGSQVCVMGADLSAQLPGSTATGIFAFRYLAPGYLGLVGEITPASVSTLTFKVADLWPIDILAPNYSTPVWPGPGKTFLVDAWMTHLRFPTSDAAFCPGGTPVPEGDPLDPNGSDPCVSTWLDTSPDRLPTRIPDGLSVPKTARPVDAAGMGEIDAIPSGVAVHGVFVVRAVTGPCPGASPQDSRGCDTWRILAKLADVTVAKPTQTAPTAAVPTATAPTGYPVDRALTTAELAAVMAGPALAVNTTLVAAVTIDSSEAGTPGCVMNDYPTIGAVRGMRTLVCVFGGGPTPARIPGIFAFRYLGPGALDLLGQITPASSSRPVFGATGWPWSLNGWDTFLVGGYLIREPTGWRIADTLNGPTPSTNTFLTVQVDAAAGIDSMDPSQYGVFVVTAVTVSFPASSMGPQGDGVAFHVVAKVADISVPGAAASPSPSPRESPAGPPATPLAPALTGVIGTSNRPLTVDELETLMVGQPDHLAGRIVIVEAPIPTQISCQSDANGGGCAVNTKPLAQTGIWAVRIGTEGALSLVGQMDLPQTSYIFTLDQIQATWIASGDRLFLVDAWIGGAAEDSCDVVGAPCYEVSWLGATPDGQQVNVQLGAYHLVGGGKVGGGPAIHGVFLIRTRSGTAEVVARMETAAP